LRFRLVTCSMHHPRYDVVAHVGDVRGRDILLTKIN